MALNTRRRSTGTAGWGMPFHSLGSNMQRAYLVQHLHVLSHGEDDVKVIGIYSSMEAARAAVDRLKHLPGFRDSPRIASAEADHKSDGFYIDEYAVDQDHWQEGYEPP